MKWINTDFKYRSTQRGVFKKPFSVLLILATLVQIFPPTVLAQSLPKVASSKEETLKSSDLFLSSSAVLGATTTLDFSVENALQSLVDGEKSVQSAKFQALTKIHKLYKNNFGVKEKVSFVIDNPTKEENILTKVTDPTGKPVDVRVETLKKNNSLVVSVLPPSSFTPGKYTLEVEDKGTDQMITQDFTWGVLALNTNKSVYSPFETAKLSFAVLDEAGKMVCDAGLELRITSPVILNEAKDLDSSASPQNDDMTILSTKNGKIRVNNQCDKKEFSLTPDYEADYLLGEKGTYELALTAETKNGTYSIKDQIQVSDSLEFDIERNTATRIYPFHAYPVEIKITANENFTGTVVEMVPESFEVIDSSSSGILKHEKVAVGSKNVTPSSNVLGASTSLTLPYIGSFKVTQLFGEEVTDPLMKAKYERHGVIGHDGVDFSMPIGTPVVAVDDGEIVMAEIEGDYGTTVVIRHSWGQSYYGHLSKIGVKRGDKVKKGEEIGKSGDTGLSTAPHLHFGIKLTDNNPKNGYFGKIDPAPLLGITKVTDILGVGSRGDNPVKLVSWEVSLKKGESVALGYSYRAPLISPQFYTLGPVRLYSNNAVVYGEKRVWQIAVDDMISYSITDGSSTATTVSGACDTSLTNNTVSDGGQGTVIRSICVGRSDAPVVKWNKTLTWETMGVPAGATVTMVNGLYKYRVAQETHAATAAMGAMQLRNSDDTAACASSDLEASFDPGAVNASYTTRNASGNVDVSAGCQASNTSVTIRLNMTPATGNNASATTELRADDIQLDIHYVPTSPILDQIHYRWRNDDNDEVNATFRRSEDTSMTRAKSVVMRLRFEVSNEGSASASLTTYRLEYGTLSTTCSAIGSWTAVPVSPTTEHFDIEPDSNGISDGSATTNVTIGGGLTDENTTFVAGEFKDTGNTTSGISLTTSQYTEIEYALQANSNAVDNTTYCFRLTNAGSTTNFRYSQYAEWTVGEPTMDQNHYRWRNDDGAEAAVSNATITLHPTGQGNYTGWTANGCTENTGEWDCVNDNNTGSGTPGADDGTSTHLTTTTGGARSSFTLNDNLIPGNSTISQLQIFMVGAEVAASGPDATVTAFYRLNSSDTDCAAGASAFGGTTYTTASCTFSSLSLSATDLNNLEIGILFSANDPTITKVYVTVTYSATAATWKQVEDTEHTGQSVSQNVRLRVEVANTGGVSASRRLQIAYAERTGGTCGDETFIAIPTSSGSEFQMTDSTNFSNEAATTTQLTATGDFIAGYMLDTANQPAAGFSIVAGDYTEMEYNFLVNSSAAGKTWCFKLTDNGVDLDTYTRYPVLSVSTSGPTLVQLLRHGKWFNGGVKQPFTF